MRFLIVLLLFAIAPADDGYAQELWGGTWASAQMAAEQKDALPADSFTGATLRQIVRLSAGGTRFRIRVSNAFGTKPLHLLAVHVAHAASPSSSRIDVGTDRAVTFDERTNVLIPARGEYVSDPVAYPVAALSDLAITMQVEAA